MKKLSAEEVAVSKVFSDLYEFTIPDYQRPYRWGVEQALQLYVDLKDWAEQAAEEPYFLGSIVLVKSETTPHSEVIDGQQRITTLTLLLACMRDMAEPADRAHLQPFLCEPGNPYLGLDAKPRLTPPSKNVEFFDEFVQEIGGTRQVTESTSVANEAQQAVRENILAFRAELEKCSTAQLSRLTSAVLKRAFLVVVTTPDIESAYQIFAVMNDRGLELTAPDIVKAKIVGDLPAELQHAYAAKWESAEEVLGSAGFEDLFAHIRMLTTKSQQKLGLLKELDEHVLPKFLPGHAAAFVDGYVSPLTKVFAQVINQSFEATQGASEVNNWLRRLAQVDNSDWQPPAIWILNQHAEDPPLVVELLRRLERLATSMMVRRVISARRIQRYGHLLNDLEAGGGVGASAFELSAPEVTATVDALDGPLYQLTRVRKHVLLRLDEALSGAGGAVYDHRIISIEHVLPQSPMPASEWTDHFSDDDRLIWTHRLANLVLLNRFKNSEAQNFDFAKKKSKYFTGKSGTSTFAITTQVLDSQTWTPSTLEVRQGELMQRLTEIWDLK